jgi:hypothetical protein
LAAGGEHIERCDVEAILCESKLDELVSAERDAQREAESNVNTE